MTEERIDTACIDTVEEITVYPYQIYKVLTDQHIAGLRDDAQRHRGAATARRARPAEPVATRLAATAQTERFARLRAALTHLAALVHVPTRQADGGVRTRATATSTMKPVRGAGPMGCVG